MSDLIKYDVVRYQISECHTVADLKAWNDRVRDGIQIVSRTQCMDSVEDLLKITMQISARLDQLIQIRKELIEESINEA